MMSMIVWVALFIRVFSCCLFFVSVLSCFCIILFVGGARPRTVGPPAARPPAEPTPAQGGKVPSIYNVCRSCCMWVAAGCMD